MRGLQGESAGRARGSTVSQGTVDVGSGFMEKCPGFLGDGTQRAEGNRCSAVRKRVRGEYL
jgi:hypothetical protein